MGATMGTPLPPSWDRDLAYRLLWSTLGAIVAYALGLAILIHISRVYH